jgi:xanthine dehydrogenase accessory factor
VPREGLIDFPMTCFSGGTLEIFIEPQYPQPRLLVVGNLPVARTLVSLGKVMNYEVVAVDPDGNGHALTDAHHILSNLTDIADSIHRETYAVVATHGNGDEAAIEHLLKARPRYIGLVASQKRFQSVLAYLKSQGIADADLQRIKAPAGLDIQAQQGDEIALSILAEIIQYRRNAQQAADWSALPGEEAAGNAIVQESASAIAIDLVCNMEVEIATAKYTFVHEGKTYYFCAPGCKTAFRNNPHEYLQTDRRQSQRQK